MGKLIQAPRGPRRIAFLENSLLAHAILRVNLYKLTSTKVLFPEYPAACTVILEAAAPVALFTG